VRSLLAQLPSRASVGGVLTTLAVAGMLAVPGCGGGSSAGDQATTSGQGVSRSQQSPEIPSGDRPPGAYAETLRICSQGPVAKVAHGLGIKSTKPREIAMAMANGYLPRYRRAAFRGCLEGLKVAAGLK
jgi:hypothetical protein